MVNRSRLNAQVPGTRDPSSGASADPAPGSSPPHGSRTIADRLRPILIRLGVRRAVITGAGAIAVIAALAWLANSPPGTPGRLPLDKGPGARPEGASPSGQAAGRGARGAHIGPGALVVHVAGAVARPGVYRLPAGSRAADAVAVAGGPSQEAELAAVNLAAPVSDGALIVVPPKGGGVAPPASGAVAPGRGKVNLNTADTTALEELPGVGPATAARIIGYRNEHGPFKSAQELDKVSGIGDRKLAEILPHVTV